MKKGILKFLPSSDGMVILNPTAEMSPQLLEYCANHTSKEIINNHQLETVIDAERSILLFRQTSPFEFSADRSRYYNELVDNKAVKRAIKKFKHHYKGNSLIYVVNNIRDSDIPEYIKKMGVPCKYRFIFERVRYSEKKESDSFSANNLYAQSINNGNKNFEVLVYKKIFVVSKKEAPSIFKIVNTVNEMEDNAETAEDFQKINDYLDTLSPAEQCIADKIADGTGYEQDLEPLLHHEFKHILNDVLLSARKSKPVCGKMSLTEIFNLYVHDEISAWAQELLMSLSKIERGEGVINNHDLVSLIPLHYKKFEKANHCTRGKMLQNPKPIIKEMSTNWLKQKYPIYTDQFVASMQDTIVDYPLSLIDLSSRAKSLEFSEEYLLQRRMLYKMNVYNSTKQRFDVVDCNDAVIDVIPRMSKEVKDAIKKTENYFKTQAKKLSEAGVPEEVISIVRQRNYQYHKRKVETGKQHKIFNDTLKMISPEFEL